MKQKNKNRELRIRAIEYRLSIFLYFMTMKRVSCGALLSCSSELTRYTSNKVVTNLFSGHRLTRTSRWMDFNRQQLSRIVSFWGTFFLCRATWELYIESQSMDFSYFSKAEHDNKEKSFISVALDFQSISLLERASLSINYVCRPLRRVRSVIEWFFSSISWKKRWISKQLSSHHSHVVHRLSSSLYDRKWNKQKN